MSSKMNTPEDSRLELAGRAKARRLAMNLSQEGLARRSGISTGTVKRFEKTGHISIDSLLKIALVLEAAEDFERLFSFKPPAPASLDELLEAPAHLPQRGRIK